MFLLKKKVGFVKNTPDVQTNIMAGIMIQYNPLRISGCGTCGKVTPL
jgi:hypothetical protein